MKNKTNILVVAVLIFGIWLCVKDLSRVNPPDNKPLKVFWMNDEVYYYTNSWVYDEERNKTNPQPSNFFYTKEVITTNKVTPIHFCIRGSLVEIGARDDGVIVWRYNQ